METPREWLGSESNFFRSIASTTPDPAQLSHYPTDDDHTDINDVVSAKSGALNSGQDIINSRPYVPSVREAKMNLAISLPPETRGYDPLLSGLRIDLLPYRIDDTGGLLSAGMTPDNVKRNTAAIEFDAWDKNLIWGLESMHPNLVDEFGLINTAGK